MAAFRQAPELIVSDWLNAEAPLSLADLRGRVVLIEAFQMLCPGCVSHALPQAQRAAEAFDPASLAVIGLHAVFEHHEAQGTKPALKAFLHEYRLTFPVAIDAASPGGGVPRTMAAYAMQGTPTQILIDREGRLRKLKFGHTPDLALGAEIGSLIAERPADAQALSSAAQAEAPAEARTSAACDETGCGVPSKA